MKSLALAALAALSLCTTLSHAQTVTFGASVTNADETLTTALTWDAPGASGCVGAGHESWNGEKTAAGTQQLPAISLSGTYALTLTCTFPGDTSARLTWVAPTKNTDGSALTNLAGYRILWGTSASALNQVIQLPNPAAVSYTVESLSPGPKYFGVKAYNSVGVESNVSNVATKTITAATTREASVSLTVNPKPEAVQQLTAE